MKKNGKTTEQVYQEVTDRIVTALEEGTVPWHRPWQCRGGHRNIVSRKPYRGINQWLLELTSMSKGYASPYWITYKQAQDLGGQVRGGEKSTTIVKWGKILVDDKNDLDENGKPKKKQIWFARTWNVFNIEQADGIETPAEEQHEFTPIEEAEQVYPNMPKAPPLKHGGDRAFYSPPQDRVQLPDPKVNKYDSPEDYYSTLFHELAHSTGHESRLNRPEIQAPEFGTETYAKEELVAELTAAMVAGFIGIDLKPRHETTAAYIANWLQKLNDDRKLVMGAASKAHQAADWILNTQKEED